jgi:hypothetical protein
LIDVEILIQSWSRRPRPHTAGKANWGQIDCGLS